MCVYVPGDWSGSMCGRFRKERLEEVSVGVSAAASVSLGLSLALGAFLMVA